MRLLNYLTEDNQVFNQQIKQILQKRCKPFLNEWDGKRLLYRGMQGKYYPYGIKTTRTDRKPLDTKPNIHKWLDIVFEKKFGWKVRSESVFTTGSQRETTRYGKPYVIFPMDKYDYLYSLHIPDLYRAMHTSSNILNPIIKDIIINNKDKQYKSVDDIFEVHGEYIATELSDYYIKNKDLNNAISMNVEIMIKCNQYFCIDYEYFKYNEQEFL